MDLAMYLRKAFDNNGLSYYTLPIISSIILYTLISSSFRSKDRQQVPKITNRRRRIFEFVSVILMLIFISNVIPEKSKIDTLLYTVILSFVALRECFPQVDEKYVFTRKMILVLLNFTIFISIIFAIAWILLYSGQPFID